MDSTGILQIIPGSIFVLFIPGFAWTFIFFDRYEIDVIERIALSFGLSMAMVPLIIFYLGYFLQVKITLINSTILILLLTLIPASLYFAKKRGVVPADPRVITK